MRPLFGNKITTPSILVASRNDPWMSFARSSALAGARGPDLVDLGLAGHVNVASGYGPWPAGLPLRDRLAGRATGGTRRGPSLMDQRATA